MQKPVAIGYARISSEKQISGDSLDIQKEKIERYIKDNGWELHSGQAFKEVFTGTTSERPTFSKLLKYIKENPGKIQYFVIYVISRSTRGGSPEYLLIKDTLSKYGVELKDTEGIIQPSKNILAHRGVGYSWSNVSPSRTTEILEAEKAFSGLAEILGRTMDTSLLRVETGYKLRGSNYGYNNKKIIDTNGREVFIQEENIDEAKHIRAIFEMSAEDVYTDKEIVARVNALGFKSRRKEKWTKIDGGRIHSGSTGERLLSEGQLRRFRTNPIYCGVNMENWGETLKKKILTKTVYKGLISIDLFNKANKGKVYVEELGDNKVKILYDQNYEKITRKRVKFREDFIFKNVILCPICKASLKGSYSTSKLKKKIPYYHCERGHKGFRKQRDVLNTDVMNYLSRIGFSEEQYSILERVLLLKYRQEQQKLLSGQSSINKNIAKLQDELKSSLDAFKASTSPEMRKEFQREYDEKREELENSKIERNKMELSEEEVHDFIQHSKKLMEHPIEMLINPKSFSEQQSVFQLFFDELPTYDEVLSGTPKLSLFFKLSEENKDEKMLDVSLLEIEPSGSLQGKVIISNFLMFN